MKHCGEVKFQKDTKFNKVIGKNALILMVSYILLTVSNSILISISKCDFFRCVFNLGQNCNVLSSTVINISSTWNVHTQNPSSIYSDFVLNLNWQETKQYINYVLQVRTDTNFTMWLPKLLLHAFQSKVIAQS